MQNKNIILLLLLAGAIRYALLYSKFSTIIRNRVEISTPLNSFKRVQEGIYLYKNNIDPYQGDMIHETPLILLSLVWIYSTSSAVIPWLYITLDVMTGVILYFMSKEFVKQMFNKEKKESINYANDTEELQFQIEDTINIPKLVLISYLFNPFAILNCVGLTSTVFSNFLLASCLFFLSKRYLLPCLLAIGLESIRNLYPVVLIAPIVLMLGNSSKMDSVKVISLFITTCASLLGINYLIMAKWTFFSETLGFVFFCRELQPNIGLFWYFFMEMFDHFRTMFLITFQMNATILYLIPLTFKLRKDPLMLATVLISLTSIFRSYPCLGDIAFYLALLPIWRRCWKFMAHNFVVFCFFLISVLMMPALWYLWMYAGSANANFYFGATLAFSTGQLRNLALWLVHILLTMYIALVKSIIEYGKVFLANRTVKGKGSADTLLKNAVEPYSTYRIFLLTDLLFAYVKREFCLKYGQKVFIGGKEAKIILK